MRRGYRSGYRNYGNGGYRPPARHDGPTRLRWFDTVAAFVQDAERIVPSWDSHRNLDWWIEDTWDGVKAKALNGDTSHVAKAEELMSKLEAQLETVHREQVFSMAGAWPDVGREVAGEPESMVYVEEDHSSVGPIRILVDAVSSAGVSAEDLVDRGVTMLALVMQCQQIRPTELWVLVGKDIAGSGGGFVCVKLGTTPLDISTACGVLTSPGFARALGYGWTDAAFGTGGAWAWGFSYTEVQGPAYEAKVREMLGEQGSDTVYVPPYRLEDPMAKDPVGFINATLAKLRVRKQQED